jgi:hypothetical protein
MALVVIARKAYGQVPTTDYPNLAAKAKYALFAGMSAGMFRWICARPRKPLQFRDALFDSYTRGPILMKNTRTALLGALALIMLASAVAQQTSKHVLSSDEVKKAVPTEYFFRGQKAPVQVRNAVGFQLADSKMMLAALVDASGYSTAIQQKYQGLLITETKLNIGGSELSPGQYGFGFTSDGKFVVMDVANNDVLSTSSQTDSVLQRAVPLKLIEDGAGYKLYAGKKWVGIKAE